MTETLTSSQKKHRTISKKLRILLALLLVGIVGVGVAVRIWRSQPEENFLELSGRIEGYETDVGTKVAGRIELIAVREGDRVSKGQVLARLDSTELEASLQGASARVDAAKQQVDRALLQISVIENQIEEAQLTQQQAKDDALGRVNAAQAGIASAEAQLARAEAEVKQLKTELLLAKADRDRFEQLFQTGAVSQQRFEQAQTQFESMAETLQARLAVVNAAKEQVKIAQGNLTQSRASSINPEIRSVRVRRLQTQLQQAKAQLSAARAEVSNAQANYQEIAARIQDLEIISPIDGVVLTRTTEPGEVVATGKTLLTLINLGDVFLRGYIPEGQVGAIRVGQSAQVFLDSAPEQPLKATVSAIDTVASFTPENIYFRDDRVTQVFGLKLKINNPQGFAKPGMPADARILPESATEEREDRE